MQEAGNRHQVSGHSFIFEGGPQSVVATPGRVSLRWFPRSKRTPLDCHTLERAPDLFASQRLNTPAGRRYEGRAASLPGVSCARADGSDMHERSSCGLDDATKFDRRLTANCIGLVETKVSFAVILQFQTLPPAKLLMDGRFPSLADQSENLRCTRTRCLTCGSVCSGYNRRYGGKNPDRR